MGYGSVLGKATGQPDFPLDVAGEASVNHHVFPAINLLGVKKLIFHQQLLL